MSKKSISVLVLVFFFSFCHLVSASVVISEIKILPTDGRFIKLYNQDNETVDLTGWYLQRKTSTGSSFGSLVSKTNFENKSIEPGKYFLISRAPADDVDIVIDDLTLTESNAIQLKNTSGQVVDKVCWGDSTDCGAAVFPNPAEGESILTNHESVTIDATPDVTPSSDSSTVSDSISTSSNTGGGGGSSTKIASSTTTKNKVEIQKIKTQIIAKNFGFVDVPVSFQTITFGITGEQLYSGKYFLNFGDGDSREMKFPDSQLFRHTYFYPGNYLFSLSYYQNNFSNVPDATAQMNIKIVPAGISISRVGKAEDFFVELSNNTVYDADISNWILASEQKSFLIPRNTILQTKNKIMISPKLTNFSILDKDTLKLLNAEGEIIFDYSNPSVPDVGILQGRSPTSGTNSTPPNPPLVRGGAQTADASGADISSETTSFPPAKGGNEGGSFSSFFFLSAFVFISLSASAVYFFRRKKVLPPAGDDFQILDE